MCYCFFFFFGRLIVASLEGDVIVYDLLANDILHSFSHTATTARMLHLFHRLSDGEGRVGLKPLWA